VFTKGIEKTTNGDKLNPPLCNSLALLKLPRPHIIFAFTVTFTFTFALTLSNYLVDVRSMNYAGFIEWINPQHRRTVHTTAGV
jgi:hypothetical protein